MIKLDRTDTPAAAEHGTVYLAFDLSKAKWKLGVLLPGSQKLSRSTIAGGDLTALATRLTDMRKKAATAGRPVRVLSCYEAGLDGHWLHRWLTGQSVINHEIDPSSIEVNRRARRAKTDRIDLEKLMRTLLADLRGEPRVCSMVHVPTGEDEDRKRRTRERERLIKARTAHINRIKGLVHGQGIRDVKPLARSFIEGLAKARPGDGRPLSPRLKEEITREHERLSLVAKQLNALEAQSHAELSVAQTDSPQAKVMQLIDLKGIGPVGGQGRVNDVFSRHFNNPRQVGSYVGLTGTPYESGARTREQGISKAGNRRAGEFAIQLAWLWTVHQPDSALPRWFRERVRQMKGRSRRIAMVALARKLMVALWRYLTSGLVPAGAGLHPSS